MNLRQVKTYELERKLDLLRFDLARAIQWFGVDIQINIRNQISEIERELFRREKGDD